MYRVYYISFILGMLSLKHNSPHCHSKWQALLITDCHPGLFEMGPVMHEETPLPDRLFSLTSWLAALRDSDVELQAPSIWITQQPECWSQFVFCYLLSFYHPLSPLFPLQLHSTGMNIMMQKHTQTHTNTLAVSDTQTSTKKRESTKEETHIWSKQSVSGCKRPGFWTGGECKVGFTQNHENTGYWISVEGRAEQQYSSKRLLWEAKCIHNEQKNLHLS